ncbi:hypothetical protein [Segatella bryantii]|nr:hypothetical protein [Segatella bryantii]
MTSVTESYKKFNLNIQSYEKDEDYSNDTTARYGDLCTGPQ